MKTDPNNQWINGLTETVTSYRKMIDATLSQLTDEELHVRPAPDVNSVTIILRHLGGNLRSRWTDFLTTDGEKPDRNRDVEFQEWDRGREALMAYFDSGWQALTDAIQLVENENPDQPIFIRGESHTIPQALLRSVTHLTYHVGQITMIARMVHEGEWQWLTIAPGKSAQHNKQTWGSKASRSVLGKDEQSD